MKKVIYAVYTRYHGADWTFWYAYESRTAAEIGAACARNDGMDAEIRAEEE